MESKNILFIKPSSGLCNQINCITKSIILAEIFNKNIYFDSFQIDYKNTDNNININNILNLDKLQNILQKVKIKVKIYKELDINKEEIINLKTNNQDISYITDIISLIKKQESEKYLYIGSPISCIIPDNYKDIESYISLNIPFSDKFLNYASKIKETFQLQNYACIHLRMEDDCLNYMVKLLENKKTFQEVENIYKYIYLEEFEKLKKFNVKTYVCTSLGIYKNNNNKFYGELKKKYNLIDKNDLINSINIDNDDNNCRELYGIIDYIIAKEANYFVGCDWSSFSILLYNNHIHYKKNTKLLNLWKMCND